MTQAPRRDTASLTRGEATRAQQAFITTGGLWGVWSQSVGIGTAVFTGYALHLGADASYISLFTAVAYLLATVQLLMPVLGRYLRRSAPSSPWAWWKSHCGVPRRWFRCCSPRACSSRR